MVIDTIKVDSAAISLRVSESRTEDLMAASDSWAAWLEELQYTVGEGPSVQAFTERGPVLVADLDAAGGRWPGFSQAAHNSGAAAAFAFPLRFGGVRLGALALYRRRAGGLSDGQLADAAIYTELATNALFWDTGKEEVAESHDGDVPGSMAFGGHYQDVSVATGMLAARLQCSLDDAFLRLRAHAFSEQRTILEVARDVVAQQLPLDSFPA